MNRQGVWWETRKINTVLAPPEKLLLDDHCRFTFPSSTLLPYPSALNLGCLLINTVPTKCSSQQLRLSALLVPLPVLPFPISSRGSLLTTQYLHSSAASSGRPSLITPGSPASCQLYLIHGHWSLSCVWLFGTQWTAACQASLSFTISQSVLKFMSIESVMLSNNLFLCCPLPSDFILPSIRVISNESAFHIRWSKY